jgi:hypothetical protein
MTVSIGWKIARELTPEEHARLLRQKLSTKWNSRHPTTRVIGFAHTSDLDELKSANGMSLWVEGPNMYMPACAEPVPEGMVPVFTVGDEA